jgi:hypothetical protein
MKTGFFLAAKSEDLIAIYAMMGIFAVISLFIFIIQKSSNQPEPAVKKTPGPEVKQAGNGNFDGKNRLACQANVNGKHDWIFKDDVPDFGNSIKGRGRCSLCNITAENFALESPKAFAQFLNDLAPLIIAEHSISEEERDSSAVGLDVVKTCNDLFYSREYGATGGAVVVFLSSSPPSLSLECKQSYKGGHSLYRSLTIRSLKNNKFYAHVSGQDDGSYFDETFHPNKMPWYRK